MLQEEVKLELRRYLAGLSTLKAFEDWFWITTWDTDSGLVGQIRLRLAEHDRGDLDEDELKSELFVAASNEPFTMVGTGTANEVVTLESRVLVAA